MPYARHRWLSVLHASLHSMRLMNALPVYYSCDPQPTFLKLYQDSVREVQRSCSDVSSLRDLKKLIASLSETATADGKERKARICDKLLPLGPNSFHLVSVLPHSEKTTTWQTLGAIAANVRQETIASVQQRAFSMSIDGSNVKGREQLFY